MAELSSMARPDLALTKAAGFTRPAGPYPPPPRYADQRPSSRSPRHDRRLHLSAREDRHCFRAKNPCLSLICCCLTLQPDPDSIWQRPDGEAGARVEGQYFGTQQERVAAAALTGAKL